MDHGKSQQQHGHVWTLSRSPLAALREWVPLLVKPQPKPLGPLHLFSTLTHARAAFESHPMGLFLSGQVFRFDGIASFQLVRSYITAAAPQSAFSRLAPLGPHPATGGDRDRSLCSFFVAVPNRA